MEQPKRQIAVLNVMANISKQATLLDGLDVSTLKWRVCGCGLNRFVHEGMNHISNVEVHLKDSQWKCKYSAKEEIADYFYLIML